MRVATALVLAATLAAPMATQSTERHCTDLEKRNGVCGASGTIRDNYVELNDSNQSSSSGTSGNNNAGGDAGGTPPAPAPEPPPRCSVGYVGCSGLLDGTEDEPVVITLSDIA